MLKVCRLKGATESKQHKLLLQDTTVLMNLKMLLSLSDYYLKHYRQKVCSKRFPTDNTVKKLC